MTNFLGGAKFYLWRLSKWTTMAAAKQDMERCIVNDHVSDQMLFIMHNEQFYHVIRLIRHSEFQAFPHHNDKSKLLWLKDLIRQTKEIKRDIRYYKIHASVNIWRKLKDAGIKEKK
jgi:hypothetical protein